MQGSRFIRSMPPFVPYTGPLEPDEPSEPKEPMPLKTRLATFLAEVEGL